MLGEQLKRLREAKGLALAEISESTNIGTRFLKAIENENYDQLPGGLFTRSFIRAHAKAVGMDPDEAVALYQSESGTPELPQADPQLIGANAPEVPLEEPSHAFLKSAIAAGVGALVLGLGSWKVYEYLNRPSAQPAVSATPTQGAPAVSETPQSPAPSVPETQPVSLDNGLTLTLEATDECWIGYKTDTGERAQLRLMPGETKTIAASESIDLSVGNTRAVNIRINNRDARFPENTPIVLKRMTITPATASALLQ